MILLLAIAWLANQHSYPSDPYQAPQKEQHETDRIMPLKGSPESTNTETGAEKSERRAELDLEAQQAMANWSWWQMIATWLGVALLFATLWESTRAAQAAVQAANTAEQALTVLERPYVVIDARTHHRELSETVHVRFANLGRAVAFTGVVQGDFFVADEPPPQFKPQRQHDRGVQWVIPPGPNSGTVTDWPIGQSPETIARIRAGEAKLYFLAVISYRSGGDTWYETGVCNLYDTETKGFAVAGGSGHNFMT